MNPMAHGSFPSPGGLARNESWASTVPFLSINMFPVTCIHEWLLNTLGTTSTMSLYRPPGFTRSFYRYDLLSTQCLISVPNILYVWLHFHSKYACTNISLTHWLFISALISTYGSLNFLSCGFTSNFIGFSSKNIFCIISRFLSLLEFLIVWNISYSGECSVCLCLRGKYILLLLSGVFWIWLVGLVNTDTESSISLLILFFIIPHIFELGYWTGQILTLACLSSISWH